MIWRANAAPVGDKIVRSPLANGPGRNQIAPTSPLDDAAPRNNGTPLMKYAILAAFALALAPPPAPAPAEAKGCLKGALVGGVAGHYAGHHGVLGAIGGCIVGHHLANEKAKEQAAQPPAQARNRPGAKPQRLATASGRLTPCC